MKSYQPHLATTQRSICATSFVGAMPAGVPQVGGRPRD
jgi:hypothetical protein